MKSFLKRKFNISYFAIFSLILVIFMILFRKAFIYLLFTLLAALFVYLNYYIRLPFDVSPILFLSLVISRQYSFLLAIIFIFVAGILPMVFAGGSFDHTTIFYLTLIIMINLTNTFLKVFPFVYIFIGLAILHHILAFFGSMSFGNNPHKELVNLGIKVMVDCFYVLTLGGFVIGLV
jgi:hypothetical protein